MAATESDFVPPASEIVAEIARSGGTNVTMHDGSVLRFTRVPPDYDVSNRLAAMTYLKEHAGEVVTGVLFADENSPELHEMNNTPAQALSKVPFEKLCPGAEELAKLQEAFR